MLQDFIPWSVKWLNHQPVVWLLPCMTVSLAVFIIAWKRNLNRNRRSREGWNYGWHCFGGLITGLVIWLIFPVFIGLAAVVAVLFMLYHAIEGGSLLIARQKQRGIEKERREIEEQKKFDRNLREVKNYDPEAYELLSRSEQ